MICFKIWIEKWKKYKQNIKDYQPPVDSEPEDVVSEAAPPPKPEGTGEDDGEGAEDAGNYFNFWCVILNFARINRT